MSVAARLSDSQPLDARTIGTLGIARLNLGSGSHIARDYDDPESLYIDEAAPSGIVSRHPADPRILLVDDQYLYLRCRIPPLPIESRTIREVFCEHLIEHLEPAAALELCREVRRVLVPGGVFRISTPDLGRYVRAFGSAVDGAEFVASRWRTLQPLLPELPDRDRFRFGSPLMDSAPRPALLLNQLFYLWGHAWIYDAAELARLLEAAGFSPHHVREVSFRRGHDALARWDNAYRSDESLYMEATA